MDNLDKFQIRVFKDHDGMNSDNKYTQVLVEPLQANVEKHSDSDMQTGGGGNQPEEAVH